MGSLEEIPPGLIDYVNVPPLLGMAISGNLELLGPLSSTLGLEDMYDILEVRRIDAHNMRVIRKAADKEARR